MILNKLYCCKFQKCKELIFNFAAFVSISHYLIMKTYEYNPCATQFLN